MTVVDTAEVSSENHSDIERPPTHGRKTERQRQRTAARADGQASRRRRNKFLARRKGTFRARVGVAVRMLGGSMRRNGPLTIAAVLSSAVALALVGGALVTSYGVSNATTRWQGGIETIVFMDPSASQFAIESIESRLLENPQVDTVRVVDQDGAYQEFTELFQNNPALIDAVSAEALPVSLRITPVDGLTEDEIESIGGDVADASGVWQVVFAKDTVRSVLMVSSVVQYGLGVLALLMGAVAGVLTFAASRAAAFARRDELAVMRTMGAPRWLIRLPFIGEGLFAGLAGGAVAVVATWFLGRSLNTRVADGEALAILRNFSVSSDELLGITALLLAAGAAGGALGAALAVGRYVRVGDGSGARRR